MLNVLINAYAVSPNWGSEPGMGWNWVINIARYCNVFVITEGEWRDDIEEALKSLPQKENIHFYFNPVSDRIRKMCWNQGDWRFYLHYRRWQKSTLKIARRICSEEHIDITHQLNMIGFREPGLLWKIKGIKHVWGPIGSMGAVPVHFLKDLKWKDREKYLMKNLITGHQIRYGNVRKAIKGCDVLIASLDVTHDMILRHYGRDVEVMSETGLTPGDAHVHKSCEGRPVELLWVGRFIPTKKLSVALEALSKAKHYEHFHLSIIGSGNEEQNALYKQMAEDLGISDICTFLGRQPNDYVQTVMQKSDLFVFSSIYEGGPHVILESIANSLPILCFDTCGQGVTVDDRIGFKVPLTSLEDGVKGFSERLDFIDEHRDVLVLMSSNCKAKQVELTWDWKARRMFEIYEQVINI